MLSFFSNKLDMDLVVKIYKSQFEEDAQNEFQNMQLLEHKNILKVFDFRRIYIEQDDENSNDNESSGSISLDGEEMKESETKLKDKEAKKHFANILIVMEKADKNLK